MVLKWVTKGHRLETHSLLTVKVRFTSAATLAQQPLAGVCLFPVLRDKNKLLYDMTVATNIIKSYIKTPSKQQH